VTDGGRREDLKYRSAARHRAATPRKDTQAKWNGRKAVTAQRSGWLTSFKAMSVRRIGALGRKGERGVRG
jgi:hypothetical protein